MTGLILHNYPQSPVAEKVRTGLGIKKLAWASVEIPRLPPKPDLTPLTGGYRRTPVLQVGADIYCDSQCILRELDRRFPEPTFFPGGGHGFPYVVSRWSDVEVFNLAVALVIGSSAAQMPPEWVKDRGRLYFGRKFDAKKLSDDLAHSAAQLRGELGWINDRLAGRDFVLGDKPGMPDLLCYYIVWFLRARWDKGPAMIAEFSPLAAWEKRMQSIGHGNPTPMTPAEALEIAARSEPQTPEQGDPRDPQGLKPGMKVSVVSLGDGGDPAVKGAVRFVSRDTIALLRKDKRAGKVCIHFPRVGYRVTLL
ncbi:MAG: glutathione S-transferase family protein [Pseudomonadota bacterium]|nr:glutathione S-transferase family protein [Pseudomonadota bacterium]